MAILPLTRAGQSLRRTLATYLLHDLFTYPAAELSDAFTDTNGTNLTAHTMDIGSGWAAQVGTWQIQSNKAKLNATGGDGQNVATATALHGQVTVTADLVTPAAGGVDAGLIVNWTDSNNYWVIAGLAGGSWSIIERAAGSFTARATGGSGPINSTTYAIEVFANEDEITLFVDGAKICTYTVASRPQKSAAIHGIRVYGPVDNGSAFDNFVVRQTRLAAHTMDAGAGWIESSGWWEVTSAGKAQLVAVLPGQYHLVTADAGSANVTLTCDLTVPSGTIESGVVLNYVDDNNYWLFTPSSFIGGWALYEFVSGAANLRDSTVEALTGSTTYAISVVTNGDTITASVGGVQKATYTGSPRGSKTATKFGLAAYSSDNGSLFDNFVVQ